MTVRGSASQAPVATLDGAASAIAIARRAVLADRYPANSLTVEWRDFADLSSIVREWRELAERALEPNVFYEPAFALAAAPAFGGDAGALLVWSGTSPRRLLGLFPARIEKRRYGVNLPILLGWTHPFAPLGVPLVEREAAEPIVAAWLAHLASDPALPGTVVLPFLTEEGPFASTLEAIVRRAQMPVADFDRHRRALLAPAGERGRYLEHAVGRRRVKEIRRQWRRLSDTGAVLFTTASKPAAVAAAAEDFLVLEARGWKGRAGTAAAHHVELCRFMRTAMPALADDGKVAIDRIMVDGRSIAATIMLRSGRCAWFWKIAYDEKFARFSPGVMLSAVLTNELVEDTTLVQTDSCATADHPMIDHLWRERVTLCNRMIAVRPQPSFALVRRLEALRSAAISGAKGVRDNIRGRFRR